MENSRLNEADVIALNNSDNLLGTRLGMPPTFCAKEVREKIRSLLLKETKFDIDYNGICKVLYCDKPGWKTGRIKIMVEVEFVEDEPVKKNLANDASAPGGLDHLRTLDVEQAEN